MSEGMELSSSTSLHSNNEINQNSGNVRLSQPGDIFNVNFHDLKNSPKYGYLQHGFQDAQDFEDFKQDLRDFRRLKREVDEDCLDIELTPLLTRKPSRSKRNNQDRKIGIDNLAPPDVPKRNLNYQSSVLKESVEPGYKLPVRQEFEFFEDSINRRKALNKDSENFEWKHLPKRIHIRETSKLAPVPRISSREYLAYKLPNSPLSRRRSQQNGDYTDLIATTYLQPDSNSHDGFSSLGRRKLKEDFEDFQISNLTGLLSRQRRVKPNMDSPTVDDHFQEFERVYETIHSRRNSTDMDLFKKSQYLEDDPDDWTDNCDNGLVKSKKPSSRFSSTSSLNDVFSIEFDEAFSDFFNTDEDFVEFEREFERVRYNRRSRVLSELKRISSCDIFSDVKSFCDRSKREAMLLGDNDNSPTRAITVKDTSAANQKVVELEVTNSQDSANMWNSLEDWDYVLNKLKRNSRIFADSDYLMDLGATNSLPCLEQSSRHSLMCNNSRDCQYTCHHTCVPSVSLDCKTVSPTEVPSTPDGSAAETSLSDKRAILVSPKPEIPAILEEKVTTDIVNGVSKGDNQTVNNEQSETSPLLPPLAESEHTLVEPSNENDETDSGYRSGTIPDEKLPKHKGQATLNREELKGRLEDYNHHVPNADFLPDEGGETFQGFLKVTLNFIRPITMSLGVRPPSIYEMLTKEHIVEQNTQSIAFYMPRDTVKSIHTSSQTTTKEVITDLLKKFHIIDHPRKFAMYEQEFDGHKIVKLRRVTDKEYPLHICLNWDTEYLKRYRLVLQENETGEIVWDGFSLPELNNFLVVLAREENEYISQLQYKYKVMRRIITQRLKEIRKERRRLSKASSPTGSSSPSSPGDSSKESMPSSSSC